MKYLAEKLPSELISHYLRTTQQIQEEFIRADVLGVLIKKMPNNLLSEIEQVVWQIQEENSRAVVFCALIEKLPSEFLDRFILFARQTQDNYGRAITLVALEERLPNLLDEALQATRRIENTEELADILCILASRHPEFLGEALQAARQIRETKRRAWAIFGLARHFSELLGEAFQTTKKFCLNNDEASQDIADILDKFIDKLPPSLLSDALQVAEQIEWDYLRTDVFQEVAISFSQLPLKQQYDLVSNFLSRKSEDIRPVLIGDLNAFTKIILNFSIETTAQDIAQAIKDVSIWWA